MAIRRVRCNQNESGLLITVGLRQDRFADSLSLLNLSNVSSECGLARASPAPDNSGMRVLGLETSCDDTGVAVFDTERGLLAHKLYSQSAMHAEYGGVVPELASRDHIRKLLPLVREVLTDAKSAPGELDGVAYTTLHGHAERGKIVAVENIALSAILIFLT